MDCIFCKIADGSVPSKKIYEDDLIVAFLDINPHAVGHTLIIPKEHTKDINSIPSDMLMYIMDKAKDIAKLLDDKYHIDGFSIVQNNGIAQDVKHFHIHIIPKYKNKANKKNNCEVE